jgi:ssDNA thymidine ADP-ribosyltransferase, DarT
MTAAPTGALQIGDQEVKEKRQAEFLVHDWCPLTAIEAVGVIDEEIASRVQPLVAAWPGELRVEIRPEWY